MNIKDLEASLDYLFKAQLTGFIWGHAGLGKTTVARKYAEKRGWHFFPFYLGTMSDTGDILGLADFVKNADGRSVATEFAMPIWLREAIDYCNKNPNSGALIFLDEFNRGRRDILNGMFSLALDKTFHTIRLPENCHVLAAGNPPTDEYFVTDVNETALMARFVHIKLEPTVEEWLAYANKNAFEPTLVSFIEEQPKLLEDAKSTFDLPIKVDRRSYERLNRLFKLDTPKNLLDQLAAGIIGIERVVAYNLHLKNLEKPLSAQEVYEGKRQDAVKRWSNLGNTNSSLLTKTVENIQKSLEDKPQDKLDSTQKENLLSFILLLPKEIAYILLKNISFKSNPAADDFLRDDKSIKTLAPLIRSAKGVK